MEVVKISTCESPVVGIGVISKTEYLKKRMFYIQEKYQKKLYSGTYFQESNIVCWCRQNLFSVPINRNIGNNRLLNSLPEYEKHIDKTLQVMSSHDDNQLYCTLTNEQATHVTNDYNHTEIHTPNKEILSSDVNDFETNNGNDSGNHSKLLEANTECKDMLALKSDCFPFMFNKMPTIGLEKDMENPIAKQVVTAYPFRSLHRYFEKVATRGLTNLPVEEEMSYEGRRLQSFENFLSPVSAIRLAQAGFYCSGQGDETTCFSCGLRYDHWRRSDEPLALHRLMAPMCPFILGEDSRNTPIHPEDSKSVKVSDDRARNNISNTAMNDLSWDCAVDTVHNSSSTGSDQKTDNSSPVAMGKPIQKTGQNQSANSASVTNPPDNSGSTDLLGSEVALMAKKMGYNDITIETAMTALCVEQDQTKSLQLERLLEKIFIKEDELKQNTSSLNAEERSATETPAGDGAPTATVGACVPNLPPITTPPPPEIKTLATPVHVSSTATQTARAEALAEPSSPPAAGVSITSRNDQFTDAICTSSSSDVQKDEVVSMGVHHSRQTGSISDRNNSADSSYFSLPASLQVGSHDTLATTSNKEDKHNDDDKNRRI